LIDICKTSRRSLFAFSFGIFVMALAACSKPADRMEIKQVRTIDAAFRQVPAEMSSSERFGFSTSSPSSPRRQAKPVSLSWKVPEGWEPLPTGGMRAASFRIGTGAECVVSLLPGTGGGLEANINRWRHQMGLEPLSGEAIAALPKIHVLGVASPFVEMSGTFTGMSGTPQPDWALLGTICLLPESSIFVKLTGPADEVLSQREAFQTFCQSLQQLESDQ